MDKTKEIKNLNEIIEVTIYLLENYQFTKVYFTSYDSDIIEYKNNIKVKTPGPGSIISILKNIINNEIFEKKVIIYGKGNDKLFLSNAIEKVESLLQMKFNLKNIIMIGDRLDTDIRAGNNIGINTCLVESGCDNYHSINNYDRPTLVASSIEDFINDKIKIIDIPDIIKNDILDILSLKSLILHKKLRNIIDYFLIISQKNISRKPRRVFSYPELNNMV